MIYIYMLCMSFSLLVCGLVQIFSHLGGPPTAEKTTKTQAVWRPSCDCPMLVSDCLTVQTAVSSLFSSSNTIHDACLPASPRRCDVERSHAGQCVTHATPRTQPAGACVDPLAHLSPHVFFVVPDPFVPSAADNTLRVYKDSACSPSKQVGNATTFSVGACSDFPAGTATYSLQVRHTSAQYARTSYARRYLLICGVRCDV